MTSHSDGDEYTAVPNFLDKELSDPDVEELDTYMGFTTSIVSLLGRISRLPAIRDESTAAMESKSM